MITAHQFIAPIDGVSTRCLKCGKASESPIHAVTRLQGSTRASTIDPVTQQHAARLAEKVDSARRALMEKPFKIKLLQPFGAHKVGDIVNAYAVNENGFISEELGSLTFEDAEAIVEPRRRK